MVLGCRVRLEEDENDFQAEYYFDNFLIGSFLRLSIHSEGTFVEDSENGVSIDSQGYSCPNDHPELVWRLNVAIGPFEFPAAYFVLVIIVILVKNRSLLL